MTEYGTALLWAVVVGAGLATLALKSSFTLAIGYFDGVPPRLRWVLGFVPAAVLAGLVAPAVLLSGDGLAVAPWPRLAAAGLAAVVAWRTGSVPATIAVGMVALWSLRAVA